MRLPLKLLAKILLNAAILYLLNELFSGFTLKGDWSSYAYGALVLTALNVFLKPVLKFVTTPLRWLTLGLFSLVIHIFILWLADKILIQLTIDGVLTLFISSIIIAILNTII